MNAEPHILRCLLCGMVHCELIVLLLLRHYPSFQVPLRYQLLFMGSRSLIKDPLQGSLGTLPLFRRNVEKERFDRAITWLKKNIDHLLSARGIGYDNTKDMLFNMHQLFVCELCPKLAL
jgi:hypothetical protein